MANEKKTEAAKHDENPREYVIALEARVRKLEGGKAPKADKPAPAAAPAGDAK